MAYALALSKTFNAATSAATFTFTAFGATIPAGTLLDIGVGGNLDTRAGSANAKILTCNDNSTQAGIANIYLPMVANVGGTTVGLIRVRCFTTRAILTGDTITVTVTGGTFSRRSALLTAWSGASAATQPDKTADQSARVASPITMGATAVLAESAVELAVAMSIWRGGAVLSGFTQGAGYTAIAGASSGGTTPNTEVNGSYKVNVGTAAETETHTFTSFSSGAGKIVTYRPTSYTERLQAPTFTVLDTFNAGASQNVDARAGWGAGRAVAGDFSMKTDAVPTVAGVSLGTPASNLWATSLTADQEACATVGAPDTFYLICRGDTASGNLAAGYLGVIGWTGQIDIRKYDGTVLYTSASDTFPRPAAGDSYCFSCLGTTLTVWRRASGGVWQAHATVQDSTFTGAGFIGMKAEAGTAVTLTDFGGGSLGSSTNTPLTLSATAVGTAALAKGVGKIVAASGVGSASISRAMAKTVSATGVGTASVTKRVAKTVTATGVGTASVTKRVGKSFSATAVGTASLNAVLSATHNFLVTLTATAVGTASLRKGIAKTVSTTAVGTASLSSTKAIVRTLTATAVGTASVTKGVAKNQSATAVGTASVRKGVGKTLSATAVGTARLILDYRVPPGGGGFGAEMSKAFLERYQPGYQARYTPGYKPTIRRQGK